MDDEMKAAIAKLEAQERFYQSVGYNLKCRPDGSGAGHTVDCPIYRLLRMWEDRVEEVVGNGR